MGQSDRIQLFEDKRIRTAWDAEKEEWYFSIVDVVAVLTDQPDARHASTYWAVLKKRLNDEGAGQLLTNCKQLKLTATDGKKRLTDVADTEQLLRIIQSIPSPKAEPFKLWLAQVGRERIEETIDPELTIDRALETYLKIGYSREWINQRLPAPASDSGAQGADRRVGRTRCTKGRGIRDFDRRDHKSVVWDEYAAV